MAVCTVSELDVQLVASKIKIKLTDEQIQRVIAIYSHEEECDPHGRWDKIVEYCIFRVV
jgi:hypothetical protein